MTTFNTPRPGHTGPNPPTHRNTDPDTSREAAMAIHPSTLAKTRREVYATLLDAGPVGATTDEVAEAMGRIHVKNGISRRLTDLGELGLARVIGRRPGLSGRNQQVWATTTTTTEAS